MKRIRRGGHWSYDYVEHKAKNNKYYVLKITMNIEPKTKTENKLSKTGNSSSKFIGYFTVSKDMELDRGRVKLSELIKQNIRIKREEEQQQEENYSRRLM